MLGDNNKEPKSGASNSSGRGDNLNEAKESPAQDQGSVHTIDSDDENQVDIEQAAEVGPSHIAVPPTVKVESICVDSEAHMQNRVSSSASQPGGMTHRASPEDIALIRSFLGRLQNQVASQQHEGVESPDVAVVLKQDEIALLGRLFGAGLIRAPSVLASSIGQLSRELTGIQLSTIVQKVRGDANWPIHVGFRDLTYEVNVPTADVGIPNVASTLYKLVRPLLHLISCKRTERMDLPILRKVSGTFEAGKPTLVLGPPGCGVTTLFKVLSGRAKVHGNFKQSGEVYFSGFKPAELHVRKLSTYVDQMDIHTAVLTVRETLAFAYECFGGAQEGMKTFEFSGVNSSNETSEELKKLQEYLDKYPDFVIQNLGLTRAANTIVGNEMLRGVSGGERRRVTSAEMIMSRRPLAFYDQISTGLDSAATFDICRRITAIARNLDLTPVVALLQPPPEVYDLFDEILIMALGYTVYHGPRENVLPYFSSIGFDCPFDRDIADFIQEVTTPARTKYQTRPDAPDSEEAMAKAWQASSFSEAKRVSIEHHCNPENKIDSALRKARYDKSAPIYVNSCFEELKFVLKRHMQLLFRDPAFVMARVIMSTFMGIFIGTIFINIDPDLPESYNASQISRITQRYGVMFSTMMQAALGGMSQVPLVLMYRPVYYKQSGSYFYRTINYVISETIATTPTCILESVILGTLVFWITGIVPTASHSTTGESDCGRRFMMFLSMMIVMNLSFSAYLRAVAAAAPSASIGQVVAGISIAATVLYSGFIITQDAMPVWFEWIYYLSPIAWGYRSAVLIVFKSIAFTSAQQEFALDLFSFSDNESYLWGGYVLLLGYMLVDIIASFFAYRYIRHVAGARQTKSNPEAEDSGNPDVAEVEKVMKQRSSTNLHEVEAIRATKLGTSQLEEGLPVSALNMASSAKELSTVGFTPVDLIFRNLWYSVQSPTDPKGQFSLDLLKGISGYAKAGTLTALMGSSGAGKSTLMDVLALRKTSGEIKGEVLVNGRPQEATSFSRVIGYVEQNDIHSPTATVEEALIFSAMLRQPKTVSTEEKLAFVESVISTLALEPIRAFTIGFKSSGGLSTEQAKRLTIGVELAANPAIVFADEPTSGLDANSARVVMDGLERIARAGRTVVCTIHQPSKDIFFKFDHLLLLRRGGEMVYFGELGDKSQSLLEYLQNIPGTAPMPNARYNPANYMLEAIGAGAGVESVVDYAHEYNTSEKRIYNEAKIEALIAKNLEERPEIVFEDKFASDFKTQFSQLSLRWFRAYWRNPAYNATRFIIAVFIALFFGFTFYKK